MATGSTTSTNFLSGLASGFDWGTMITQLIAADHKRVDLVTNKKNDYSSQLQEWQSFNTKLLSLKSAVDALNHPSDFQLFTTILSNDSTTVKASDMLSVSTDASASPGSYSVKINSLAQAQKLSSNPFISSTTALGSSYAGDVIINGKVLKVSETDSLSDVADNINKLNTGSTPSGVTASVMNFGTNDYRLILTSDTTGAKGISLTNGSSADIVQQFGWKDNQTAFIKNTITGGALSDRFTSASSSLKSLLGLAVGESDSVSIGGQAVALNLSTMSLSDIKQAINDAAIPNVTADVITQEDNGRTYYRLRISGTQTFTDAKNILNSLGILDHTSSDVEGKISGNSMTTGGSYITSSTFLKDIDGYNVFTPGGNPDGDYITITGTDTSNLAVNANFNISSSTTVQDLLDEIETRFGNVLAYVTSDGKIRVDDLSGSGYLAVNLADHIHDANSHLAFTSAGADFAAADVRKREVVAGADASLTVDGVQITKSSNTISDIITGVTLNLTKADNTITNTIVVNRDIDSIKNKIKDFVAKYNDVASYMNTQLSYDSVNNKPGGILFGDGTLYSVKNQLTSILPQAIWGVNSQFSIPALVGINVDKTGQLSVNDATLTGYLRTNFNDVATLFVGRGTSSSSNVSFIGYTRDSKAGEYTVHIDTAATRSASTSDTAVGGTLGGDETLTITEGGKTASVSLTSSMTISDIVNTINAELGASYNQILAGSAQLRELDNVTPISSETPWDQIFGTTLGNGDVISFSGTSRNGSSITGNYTIVDKSTDTVQGLLSAIEEAFSNSVTASVDTSGRIIVTDKTTGNSQLTLDITEPVGKGLDFGTVLKTNTGGQTGRYALAATASKDAGNHLVLTHNNYGAGYTFTISETGDLLWTGGDQTVNNGKDVAGTIGGEAATGSGRMLTGNSGNTSTAGISVTYSGTAEGVDAGTVKLTIGTAELFNRALFDITDAYEGYIPFKETSLQDNIKRLQTQIDQMEARLQVKQQTLTNQFVAMEKALSTLQNQSNWLSSQIKAMEK